MQTLRVRVEGMWCQGRHNLAVTLASIDGVPLPAWTPGAHIDVHLGNGMVRQYSLTGSARDAQTYMICVAKESASRGGSRFIHEKLRPGDELSISPPRNLFPLLETPKTILLAAGIGITPLYAMADQLRANGQPCELHYYVRERQDIAFAEALHQHDCTFWCSSEGFSPRQHSVESLMHPQPLARIYLCGPAGFMARMQEIALAYGWQPEQICSEAFAPVPSVAAAPGDNVFHVTLTSTGQRWPVPADSTIAQVLQAQGVAVPLSCEMGLCGACLTPVKQGEADHRDTVQSEAEKCASQQMIALCCSRSHSPELVIDL